jgi:CheY-like chemotaxis protein
VPRISPIVKSSQLSAQEIAQELQVDASQVREWIERGVLPACAEPEGDGAPRVNALALAHFLLRNGITLPDSLRASVHLLVIDDEAETLRATARLLKRSAPHLAVSLAEGAGNGWREVKEKLPDVVLVDMYMPELSGVDLCARIKESPLTAGVQVIGCSGQRDPCVEDAFRRAGASSLLDKPPSVERLLHALEGGAGWQQSARCGGGPDAFQ